jgi:hypothetical protein
VSGAPVRPALSWRVHSSRSVLRTFVLPESCSASYAVGSETSRAMNFPPFLRYLMTSAPSLNSKSLPRSPMTSLRRSPVRK